MSKKPRRQKHKLDIDLDDDFDSLNDEDFDMDELSRDIYSTEWGGKYDSDDRYTARRKIERRKEARQLYSQINDFEEFGEFTDW